MAKNEQENGRKVSDKGMIDSADDNRATSIQDVTRPKVIIRKVKSKMGGAESYAPSGNASKTSLNMEYYNSSNKPNKFIHLIPAGIASNTTSSR